MASNTYRIKSGITIFEDDELKDIVDCRGDTRREFLSKLDRDYLLKVGSQLFASLVKYFKENDFLEYETKYKISMNYQDRYDKFKILSDYELREELDKFAISLSSINTLFG